MALAQMHSFFWAISQPVVSSPSTYSGWEIVPIEGGSDAPDILILPRRPVPRSRVRLLRMWLSLRQRWNWWVWERLWCWFRVTRLIFSGRYSLAHTAVRIAEYKLGPIAWQIIQQESQKYYPLGRDALAYIDTRDWLAYRTGLPRGDHRLGLLVELAYCAMKEKHRV